MTVLEAAREAYARLLAKGADNPSQPYAIDAINAKSPPVAVAVDGDWVCEGIEQCLGFEAGSLELHAEPGPLDGFDWEPWQLRY